jgi:hypothetical protein
VDRSGWRFGSCQFCSVNVTPHLPEAQLTPSDMGPLSVVPPLPEAERVSRCSSDLQSMSALSTTVSLIDDKFLLDLLIKVFSRTPNLLYSAGPLPHLDQLS